MKEKIIIDTDPGVDDMLAIFYALASDALDVIGITAIFGNVTTEKAALNALRLLEIADRTEIPVARGACSSLNGENSGDWADSSDFDPIIHGKDGLGNTHLPLPKVKPIDLSAINFIVEQVEKYPGEITLVPIGPLTNIALAIRMYPQIVDKIKQVVLMGGAIFAPGNVNPAAEANIYSDPEAADIVFQADLDITMLGLDVTENIRMTQEQLAQFTQTPKAAAKFISRSVPLYMDFYNSINGGLGCSLHDPSVIAYLINPSYFEVQRYPVTIGKQGSGRGKTWAWMPRHFWNPSIDADKKVNVVLNAESEKVVEEMIKTLI